jgi:hypothetical protein
VSYWASAWINESKKDGSKFMKIRLKRKMEAVPAGPIAEVIDDEIIW